MFLVLWGVVLALCAVLVAHSISKCKRPVGMALKNAVIGVGSLVLINLLQGITGVALAVNYVTTSCVVVLGLPGTSVLLLAKLFI
jgi:pro-sigmaK processing inhibitor BofA